MLASLALRDFRTYPDLHLSLPPGLLLFLGPNGAGKTNLLEAVHLAATGRSPRLAGDAELTRFGASGYLVAATVRPGHAEVIIQVRYTPATGKEIRVNGTAASLASLAGLLPVVWFAPDDHALVSGPPARRRAFLDALLAQLDPTYAHHWLRYRETLAQRNAALRDLRQGRASDALLPVWDEQLVHHGAYLLAGRLRLLDALGPLIAEELAALGDAAPVSVTYVPAGASAPPSAADAAAWLAALLARAAPLERERGHTLVGPHRDDLLLQLAGHDARAYASQGERRTLALACKLAAAAVLRARLGVPPVLLLDDAFSELDRQRRARLAARVRRAPQALVTAATAEGWQEILGSEVETFQVTRGVVARA